MNGAKKMNNDGFGQSGAGMSDNRVAGEDQQHNRQPRTLVSETYRNKAKTESDDGGPIKRAINEEMKRHKESKEMRMKHIEDHYKR
jgi:hypothetical protein